MPRAKLQQILLQIFKIIFSISAVYYIYKNTASLHVSTEHMNSKILSVLVYKKNNSSSLQEPLKSTRVSEQGTRLLLRAARTNLLQRQLLHGNFSHGRDCVSAV